MLYFNCEINFFSALFKEFVKTILNLNVPASHEGKGIAGLPQSEKGEYLLMVTRLL